MNDYDKLFNDLLNGNKLADMIKTKDSEYTIGNGVIRIDLFGANKENVSVEVEGAKVHVKSTKKNIHNQQCKYEKTFIFADNYDPNTIEAKYEEGILEISASLFEKEKPRKIEIK